MHSCPVSTGDTWVRNNFDAYAQWAKANNSLLVLTWDEDNFLGSNQIATVFYGAHVKQGRYGTAYNHFNLLRTFEDLFGTGHAGNAANAQPITEVFGAGGEEPPPGGGPVVVDPGAQTCKFNQSCTIRVTATGGTAPLRWTATGLPWGLAMDASTGRISGKPWGSGTVRITASVTDAAGRSAGAAFPLTLNWF